MTYQDLRKKLKNFKKYPNCKSIERSPLVNPGFHGTFNMSFSEDFLLKEFGGYQYYDHDAVFSMIQKCIRHNDLFNELKRKPEEYLGIFEMSDVFGMIALEDTVDFKKLQFQQVKSIIDLLTDLGIDKKDIYPKYCGGGDVEKLTKGKYTFDKVIPEDNLTLDPLIELGIPEKNIKKDHTRNTFLALNLSSGSAPWGYRCEVEVKNNQNKLLDVATIELFLWDPVFNNQNKIVDLKDISYTAALTVTGVERLFTAANKLKDIREIEHIKKLYEASEGKSLGVEYLRTIHQIYSDQKKYDFEISRHKKYIVNKMIRYIEMSEDKIEKLLKLNADLQPWSPELQQGIKKTIEVIKEYRQLQEK